MLGNYFNWGNLPIMLVAVGSFIVLIGTFLYNTNSSINARQRHYESIMRSKEIKAGLDIMRDPIHSPVLSFVLSLPLRNPGRPSPGIGKIPTDYESYDSLFERLEREQENNLELLARLKHHLETYGQVSFMHSTTIYNILERSGYLSFIGSQVLPNGVKLFFSNGSIDTIHFEAFPQEDEFVTGYAILNSRIYLRYDMPLSEQPVDGKSYPAREMAYRDLLGLRPGVALMRYNDANWFSMEQPSLLNGFMVTYGAFDRGFFIPKERLSTVDGLIFTSNSSLTDHDLRYPIKSNHTRSQLLNKEIANIN